MMSITLQVSRSHELADKIWTKILGYDFERMQGSKGDGQDENTTQWFEHASKINYNRGKYFNKRVNKLSGYRLKQ